MFDKALLGLPGIKRVLALLGVLAAVQAAAVIGQALSLAWTLSDLWHGSPLEAQAPWIALFLACFLGKQAAIAIQDAYLGRYARAQGSRLRESLLRAALAGPAGWVRAHGTARVTTCTLEGVDQVENYLRVILPKLMGAAIIMPATLAVTFLLDWPSGIILLVVLPVIVFYMIMLGRMAQDRATRQYGTYQRLSNHFLDTLRGLPTLKALGAAKRHAAEVFQVSEDFRIATDKTLRVATLSSVVLDLLATLGVAAVAMMLGFRLVDGSMALFPALAVLVVAPEYFAPLRQFAGDFHASLDGRNALADILALTGTEAQAGNAAEADATIPAWSADSTLKLEDVGFSYPADGADGETGNGSAPEKKEPAERTADAGGRGAVASETQADCGESPRTALNGISFEARGFQRIGIVGASGSGKSTLANLLGGFFTPDSGIIEVNGQAVPADALQDASWQRQVLYIPQDPHIFHATLRQNIAFYTPDCDEAAIARAVEVVGLGPLVDELPDGLDTLIGEGGRALSGGQAHRIALARALLDSTRRILVFDEPTAHLDIETELELKQRMLPLMEGRLVLFATHRMHWLRDMNHVLVLEGGHIVEQGAPDALTRVKVPAADHAPSAGDPSTPALRASAQDDTGAGMRTSAPDDTGAGMRASAQDDTEACLRVSAQVDMGAGMRASTRDGKGSGVTDPCHPEGAAGADPEARQGQARRPKDPASTAAAASPAPRDTWVRPYFSRYRKTLTSALTLGVAAFAFAALLMFTSGYLISATAETAGNILLYYLPIAFVQVFGLGKPPLRYFERLQSHDWVFRMTSSLRVRLYKALEGQALQPGTRSVGEVLGLVSEDIGHIQNLYLRTMFPLAIGWILLAGCIVALAFADVPFALCMLVLLGAAAVALPVFAQRAIRQRMQERKDLKNRLYEGLTDDLLGAADWVFAGRGLDCVASQMARAERASALQADIDRFTRTCDLAVTAFMGIAAVAILAWAATRFGGGAASPNWIAALVLGFFPLVEAFSPLPKAAMDANAHRDSIARLNTLPETDDSLEDGAAKPMAVASHDLHIRNLRYAYPGTPRTVLDGVDLSIPAGQRVAVLGRSGSGKSTLASLVRGDIHPDAGFCTIGGKPTWAFGDAIAQQVGVVQQDAYLFDRSLRENLALARPDATDDEIWAVLDRVRLGDMARALPQGLDTIADEAGKRFSGGERNRLALARVLLADTPIILLDEPTVGLDPDTEQDVLATLLATTVGKTLVMVTHHLQGVGAFDRVVFLEDGRIELDGTPPQLARESARYRTLLAFDGLA